MQSSQRINQMTLDPVGLKLRQIFLLCLYLKHHYTEKNKIKKKKSLKMKALNYFNVLKEGKSTTFYLISQEKHRVIL